jgi:hypothetical protein
VFFLIQNLILILFAKILFTQINHNGVCKLLGACFERGGRAAQKVAQKSVKFWRKTKVAVWVQSDGIKNRLYP